MRSIDLAEDSPTYIVVFTESAESDIDDILIWMQENIGEDFALRWYANLLTLIDKIPAQPFFYTLAPESTYLAKEVRQVNYKRGRTVYRVLFEIIAPATESDEGTILILHIRHAARLPMGQEQ